ncbi:nuclear protein localization protein 4 homolog isoform X1 [Orcinus orca]|uniref:Nuclear protein localization protein 4 homolog n=6 Tax=Odontoceti TaxID=9722 RepID=A0A8C6FCT4_MONMO|nr:nuclear protein localization protein 4 homolog isoform X1 [Orcinus orca]XP_007462388.1 PREDICTED: nuclear protein localization protein 4 homolog [Lipotes vexillifer]XP_022445047.1 nuclear protein localization protein 4 homolog isoform X2 [Delphinapterus leucas]XP_029066678.1 nuclear protein localization protein 4 homolog isoform X2 [Monodon monoceros]XP_030698996.1 nuclear protein localization protein 4 homolog isoform X3 [Globicephala melas]XP_032471239.1 nuclear protein localization prote
MAESIIIRVQSPDGVKRITATKRETAATFLKKVAKEFGFQNNGFSVYINRNKTGEITASSNKSLNLLKIKHGDLLFLFPSSLAGPSSEMETSAPLGLKACGAPNVVEDEIDQYLSRQDGKIYRSRDPQLCRHGPLGKCVHCVPLEPFDEDYLNHLEPPVKHMSFHAYIRKLTGGADKGKFVALENISCKIKSGCEGHLPWPNGICTKCQPSAITLNRQKYRHVDNIMFENHTVADRFLDFWRKTGNQHFGYLYGRYTEHKDIPLGIRAEVAAIYEPPQIGTQNSLELLEDPKAEVVDEIAAKLGLRKVGWIFTDLVSEDTRKGTVRYSRNKDTYFLSSEECITAGDFQNKHPNICRLSPDGHFGSKFVTAVATGGPDNQVHFEGYQVSNQCMALVRDECLLPCKDAPELGYAKESSSEQYVPDVFYKDIDKFGNEITQLARPLPVEYLIIDITTTFPKDPVYTFSISQNPFPIENRDVLGETQDFHSLATYLSQNTSSVFLDTISDFHLLLFLVTNDVMPLQDSISLLLEAVRTRNEELAQTWKKSEQWATIEQLCSTVGVQLPGLHEYGAVGGSAHTTSAAMWACQHCTFMNQPGTGHCEMCSLPRT